MGEAPPLARLLGEICPGLLELARGYDDATIERELGDAGPLASEWWWVLRWLACTPTETFDLGLRLDVLGEDMPFEVDQDLWWVCAYESHPDGVVALLERSNDAREHAPVSMFTGAGMRGGGLWAQPRMPRAYSSLTQLVAQRSFRRYGHPRFASYRELGSIAAPARVRAVLDAMSADTWRRQLRAGGVELLVSDAGQLLVTEPAEPEGEWRLQLATLDPRKGESIMEALASTLAETG